MVPNLLRQPRRARVRKTQPSLFPVPVQRMRSGAIRSRRVVADREAFKASNIYVRALRDLGQHGKAGAYKAETRSFVRQRRATWRANDAVRVSNVLSLLGFRK